MPETHQFVRSDTSFLVAGTACAAWLYRPTGVEAPPIVVLAHGFASVRELRLDAYATRFAEDGYAALVFDYRSFGASDGEPRRVLDVRHQQADWRAAIAYARALDRVDTSRVVAWGSSFGGGHVLHLAAEDHALAAAIVQVPHVSGPASAFARSPAMVARLIAAGLRDEVGAILGRPPYRIPAAGAPGTLGMMTSPDALPMAERLAGDKRDELRAENNVAARIALHVPFYSPGRLAAKITIPVLIQIAKRDAVTPHRIALKVANQIPKGEVHSYDCSHFEPYVEPFFEPIVSEQLEFLRRHV